MTKIIERLIACLAISTNLYWESPGVDEGSLEQKLGNSKKLEPALCSGDTRTTIQQRKKRPGFSQSEPEFLISYLDRHPDR